METKNKKILIVDDDEFFRTMYADALDAEGFTVLNAKDGKEGITKMRAETPDFVILDLVMPEMDGWQVLEAVKKDAALTKIPILVLTGVASEEECRKAEESGALKCLSKLTILPEAVAKTISGIILSDSSVSIEKLREAEIGEGQRLNTIFRDSGEAVAGVLGKLLKTKVALGKLKATATSGDEFKNFLKKAEAEEEEEVMFYSVMKPPFGVVILNIKSGFLSTLSDAVRDVQNFSGDEEIDKSALDEIFNIFSNTFLSVITRELATQKTFLMNVPRMSTPDMILPFLEKDGFVFDDTVVQFIFRQEYIIPKLKEQIFEIELIFILSREGLEAMGGGRLKA
jgi:CheY-like chemotaxis protein